MGGTDLLEKVELLFRGPVQMKMWSLSLVTH